MRARIAVLPILLGLHADLRAQTAAPHQGPTIRATGQATVTSSPDRAEVDVGVVTKSANAREAATRNAEQVERVLASLRDLLGPKAEIETVSYSLQPDYQYPEQGAPKLVGYTASNIIRVTLDDLARVGSVIDQVTTAGGNQVERVRFTLKDDAQAQQRALRAATLEARMNAESIASALDLRITGIASVSESGGEPRPMYETTMARAATPIVPGTIDTTATVTVTVNVSESPSRRP